MKDRKVKTQMVDEELIDVLSAISIVSLRLAKRLQAAAIREQQESHRVYECPLMKERRPTRYEAL